MDFLRIVISDPKTGKSYQAELPKGQEPQLVGKKIGDKIDGGLCGAAGYSLELTGGSDGSGFPMRTDISGARRSFSMVTEGVGFHTKRKGERRWKALLGNTYSTEIVQVNAKVVEPGPTPLNQLFKKEEGEKKEE
ncbi:TPA: 30S ribosomal protein S6e [Candidatus Micrarchaeota archaeon]|nr:30S ribosomal protein S6e [Candidatus Micrarchaeota archaeon]